MITVESNNCGKVLFELGIAAEDVLAAKQLIYSSDELVDVLANPTIQESDKFAVIDKLFPQSMNHFFKVMLDYGHIAVIRETFEAYDELVLKRDNILSAELYYVTKPSDKVVDGFREMLKTKYSVSDVVIKLIEDKSLIGGYILKVGDTEYDKSIQKSVRALRSILIRR